MTTFRGPPLDTEPGIGALTLGGLLGETASRHAEREALVFHDADGGVVRWTYADLEREAHRVARALVATGAGKGTRVALLMGNRPEWVAAAFGTALAGGVLVAVNTFLAPPELEYVLAHSDAAVVLTQERLVGRAYVDELAEMQFPARDQIVALGVWDTFLAEGDGVDDEVVVAAADEVSPADDALVVYTSGTTAAPKGILHAQRGPALQSWRFAQQLRLEPTVRVWSAFPLFWSAGFVMVMGATLAAGGCVVLQEHFEPGAALALLESGRVTTPHAWPHQLAQLEDHPDWARRDLSSIRQCEAFTSFGRHPSVHVDDTWSPRAAYGLSETCTIVSSLPADSPRALRERCQGAILPGNSVRILDPKTGEALGPGVSGELAVKGPTLMEHYVRVPPEDCFDGDGFFHTGDAGFVDDEGYLHWTGRSNEMIKTGGANVSPVEVELALLHHPGLKAATVVGVPDALLGELVVVCAVPHDGAMVTEAGVREFLRGRIASYKIPRRVLLFDERELALTGNAKIQAAALRQLAVARLRSA